MYRLLLSIQKRERVSRLALTQVLLGLAVCSLSCSAYAKAPTAQIKAAVVDAFGSTHDGWSSDEVLLQDGLNARFLATGKKLCPETGAEELNWQLINLRKAGELSAFEVTKRSNHRHDAYRHAAEIAARLVTDRHEVSTDRMLCDTKLRAEFDRTAGELAPGVEKYRLRKAAFGLRKSRKLQPELVVRVANWGREIRSATVAKLRADTSQIPASPGVYLFRSRDGYLYVGEAADLRKRLTDHLAGSDRAALASYLTRQSDDEASSPNDEGEESDGGDGSISEVTVELHIFPPDSPAAKVRMRRAYESELIASRRPRFNVRP